MEDVCELWYEREREKEREIEREEKRRKKKTDPKLHSSKLCHFRVRGTG